MVHDLSPSALQVIGRVFRFSYVELQRAFEDSRLGSANRIDEDGSCNSYDLLSSLETEML